MIVLRLYGGLGNQLFQYAAGRRLAHARNAELVLDLDWYAHTPAGVTARSFELQHYPIRARQADAREQAWCRLHNQRLLGRLPLLPRRWRPCRENGFAFDARMLDLPDDSYLDGYWQSYRYFEDVAELIHTELTPVVPPGGGRDREIAAAIAGSEAVAVHVRRGDYVTNQATNATHGACTLDYYRAAVDRILPHLARPHFFVFSDDPSWTRAHLALPGEVTFVDHNGPDSAFQDLRLMSLCHHQILANSSFSWWGAWLNRRPGRIVIAPRQWFAVARDTSALIPEDWIRL